MSEREAPGAQEERGAGHTFGVVQGLWKGKEPRLHLWGGICSPCQVVAQPRSVQGRRLHMAFFTEIKVSSVKKTTFSTSANTSRHR